MTALNARGRVPAAGPRNADFLRAAFATEQLCLVPRLESSNRITHAGDRGEVNERHFIDFLRKYLPNRYTVEKAIVLDSEGSVSDSIDIVVFDRQVHTDIARQREAPVRSRRSGLRYFRM